MVSVVEAAAPAGSVWRNPAYVRLWISETLSRFGEPFAQIGIPIVAVLILSATPIEVGLLDAAAGAAFLVIGLPVGAWIDRRAKRGIMMRATLVRGIALLCVPTLWWLGGLQIWHLFVIAAVVGGASVFYDVAYQSYVPAIVASEQVTAANAGVETSNQLAQVVGPALGGAILAMARAPVLLLITAVGYLASFVAVASIRHQESVSVPAVRQPLRTEIAEGLRFVFGQPLLRRITLMSTAANGIGGLAMTVFPIYVLRTLALPPWAFALIGAAASAGGMLGALASARLAARLGEGRVIVLGVCLSSVAMAILATGYVLRPAATVFLVISWFCESFGVVIYNVAQVSFRQRICPPHLLGRMNASIRFMVWGISPIAALLGGFLGGWLGIVQTIAISGALAICSISIVWFSPLRAMRTLPDAAA